MLPAGREALAAPWVWGQANSVLIVLLVMLVALESCVCGWCPAKCRGVGQQGGARGWLLQLSKDAKYGFGIFFFFNEYASSAAAVFALGREPVRSGGTQKVPACSQHIAALITQGSPFL